MEMDECIQLVANYADWKAVKKLKIEPATGPRAIMEFLASLEQGLDRKVEENLRKIVDLGRVDKAIAELGAGRGQAVELIEEVNSRRVNSVIKEVCALPQLQKNEQKELAGFCRVYALRMVLNAAGFSVDYSSVEIPGMKRLLKKKV